MFSKNIITFLLVFSLTVFSVLSSAHELELSEEDKQIQKVQKINETLNMNELYCKSNPNFVSRKQVNDQNTSTINFQFDLQKSELDEQFKVFLNGRRIASSILVYYRNNNPDDRSDRLINNNYEDKRDLHMNIDFRHFSKTSVSDYRTNSDGSESIVSNRLIAKDENFIFHGSSSRNGVGSKVYCSYNEVFLNKYIDLLHH